MNLHEYQSKQIFAQYGIPVPAGRVVSTADEAVAAARELGGSAWVVKAQVHAGGRGKGGGVKVVKHLDEVGNAAGAMLGKRLVTPQTGPEGLPVDKVYVEAASAIAQELGLIGAAALLLVFMLFVARGMRVALQADDGFSKLLAAGLTFGFALQTFIIVGGVLRVVPLTGITLPFVSYGGTSVVANFVLLALLLLVSNRAAAPR